MRLTRKTKSDLLREVPLFSRCSKKELALVAGLADELSMPAGTELTVQGAAAREAFVLLEGAAVVRRNGRQIRHLGRGDVIGEIALVDDTPRTATVTLSEPSRLLVLAARDFHRLLRESPPLALKVLSVVGARLAAQDNVGPNL